MVKEKSCEVESEMFPDIEIMSTKREEDECKQHCAVAVLMCVCVDMHDMHIPVRFLLGNCLHSVRSYMYITQCHVHVHGSALFFFS